MEVLLGRIISPSAGLGDVLDLFHPISRAQRFDSRPSVDIGAQQSPGVSFVLFLLIVVIVGAIATHVIGQRVISGTERWIEHVPLVRSVYSTLKGMTDLLNFRSRFGRSTVVAFPFPRDGLWAIDL